MSRRGRTPIPVPQGVEVNIAGRKVAVKGPKGNLEVELTQGISASVEDGKVIVGAEEGLAKFHGLGRALIDNMVVGVSKGFEKRLELIGVGFRAAVKGNLLDLQLGFSHPTEVPIPEGITVKVEESTKVVISGIDRQKVGQFAAEVRSLRPPEPYKGKGIRYAGEYVRRKAGKAAK